MFKKMFIQTSTSKWLLFYIMPAAGSFSAYFSIQAKEKAPFRMLNLSA
jgi:hypothetical protein